MNTTLKKLDHLTEILKGYEMICIAFSGGVDSTLLLDIAAEALPNKVLPVMANGEFVPRSEKDEALVFCEHLGLKPYVIPINFLENPLVASNPEDRCFHCKFMIFSEFRSLAQKFCIPIIAEGTNMDDLSDYRPGLRALKTLDIKSPFIEAGITKNEIRELSHYRGLKTADKPALSCLASRIPTGEPITVNALRMVEAAEVCLKDLGLKQYRVRYHNELARIEVFPDEFETIISHREQLNWEFQTLGFRYVSLDIGGYKTGNMNTTLTDI